MENSSHFNILPVGSYFFKCCTYGAQLHCASQMIINAWPQHADGLKDMTYPVF